MQRSDPFMVLGTTDSGYERNDVVAKFLRNLRKREWRLGLGALILALGTTLAAFGYYYFASPTPFTVAVDPRDGVEARLMGAFAESLVEHKKDVRLTLVPFDDVRQSAEATPSPSSPLRSGRRPPASSRSC